MDRFYDCVDCRTVMDFYDTEGQCQHKALL